MRLLISALILLVATIDFQFGTPGTGLHIAALCAGLALAISVVIDYVWIDPLGRRDRPRRQDGNLSANGAKH